MNKDLKKFILFLIGSIIVAFAISYSYSAYQSHQQGENIDGVKNTLNFENTHKRVEDVKESGDPQEAWQNQMLEILELLGYSKVDTRPFYKRIYDKLTGKKVYNYIDKTEHETEAGSFEFCNEVLYENLNIKNETVMVEVKDNKIIEKFFDGDKELMQIELTANDDYSSYDQKIYSYITKKTITVKDVLNKDTYLNTKNGIIEYEDGRTIEFTHKNSEMNGPAIETFPNGDKIEFNFVNNKRIGEAEKFYKNGDREIFKYGENNKKNGNSTYYFANGDIEETIYVNGVLQGPAKYIYKDGAVEHYKYKDGKRIED
ncbi:MORN repeat-containing protein [Fusobacterium canifelinum]|uniref:Phosphatidylinositol-4-phosphate 5-kinase n=1 Tax=Fusobacterium canifelinum TaxID=285729 RepID=A0A3P1V450_9FUSO|nr:phosphatidylinositol-4-phosphate 5-kinase [Fusobacterium canifelinum]QQB73491.1 phosphatidylinositol-4-phosphate 5-kinase [Fusobacterium canifelinum]QQS86998.1 phosphatidylinositol-4-phosphate 5-kinase [Fusobacterium canifelinum]RRD28658.1 phosphatidylinositol-4-phosphate 5-kinase [Fusobacterium canifelinum]